MTAISPWIELSIPDRSRTPRRPRGLGALLAGILLAALALSALRVHVTDLCYRRAEALHDRVEVDTNELTSARWFTRAEVISMDELKHPEELIIPGRHAIARKLIMAWVEEGERA